MTTVSEMVREAYAHWDDPKVLTKMGRALHDHNRLPLAREVLSRAVELDPKEIPAWRYLCYTHMRDNDGEGGIEVLKRGIEATGSPILKGDLAMFSEGEKAQAIFEELEGIDDPEIRAMLIGRKVYEGEPKEAIAELKKLHAEHPGANNIRETLAWSLLGIGWRQLADIDFEAEGLPLADERIAETPESPGGYWMKTQLQLAAKNWPGLLESTEQALKAFPGEETVMQLRARAHKEQGDLARAETWLNRAIGAKPEFAGARVDLGKLYEQQERYEEAEEVFREIAVANPGYPGKHLGLAFFLSRRERWDEAETLLCEAWPEVPEWIRGGLRQNPEYKPLLERPRVAESIRPPPEAKG